MTQFWLVDDFAVLKLTAKMAINEYAIAMP